jgi:hypothetical protein
MQTLTAQFQARYPGGSLITELLTVHQSNYVVRALVQLGGTTLATGMAAANDIELAEDRAKVRALETLGFQGTSSSTGSQFSVHALPQPISPDGYSPSPLSSVAAQTTTEDAFAESKSPAIYPPAESFSSSASSKIPGLDQPSLAPDLASFDSVPSLDTGNSEPSEPPFPSLLEIRTDADDSTDAGQGDSSLEERSPGKKSGTSNQTASPQANKSDKPAKRKAGSPETVPVSIPESVDRSEEIAKIGVEMKRLGWSKQQGRDYLQKSYGKSTRQELDDTELLDFLKYLELQPSSSESPF